MKPSHKPASADTTASAANQGISFPAKGWKTLGEARLRQGRSPRVEEVVDVFIASFQRQAQRGGCGPGAEKGGQREAGAEEAQ
jgi:hypothetical protein